MDTTLVNRIATTLPADDTHPYRTGAWQPQHDEFDADDLDVIGEIPDDLDGVYLRNTENPIHPALDRYHPFDGDGMIHLAGFRGGKAFYRNRFVRTSGFFAEQEAGQSLWAGIAEHPKVAVAEGGWGARQRMKDASSTDVIIHAGQAVTSFYQCGELYRLDPLTLETLGTTSWDGKFPTDGVSAHTKVDPATGEMLFFNYSKQAPYMHYGVVNAQNELVHYTEVPLPGPRLPHDMVFTPNYSILNDCPLYWDEGLLKKNIHVARMHDKPTRFAVIPRHGSADQIRWFETDPTYVLHWTNAWEEGDEIVIEGFFQHNPVPEPVANDPMGLFRFVAIDYMETRLHRWRLNLRTGQATEESLRDDVTEFGVINPTFLGHKSRYVYAATAVPGWFTFNGLVKHDTWTGKDTSVRLADGVVCSEPVMAPRIGSVSEDDGYVLTFTSDVENDSSECVIFDAQAMTEGPVARVRLPQRISSGTHATWAPGADIPNWTT